MIWIILFSWTACEFSGSCQLTLSLADISSGLGLVNRLLLVLVLLLVFGSWRFYARRRRYIRPLVDKKGLS